jgi:RHS repeat-associated protein
MAGHYDTNGNLTYDGRNTYAYDTENRMTGVTAGPVTTTEAYDPLGRIRARITSASPIVYYLMDGEGHVVAEYSNNGLQSAGGNPAAPPLRRFMFVPGQDQPISWWEGSTKPTPNWLLSDREGSVIAWAPSSGVVTSSPGGTVSYGPYGEPSTWNMPAYGYTGQFVYPELQLYYYKARLYSPALGRFLQTDPVGYDAGDTNLYAYVGDDPTDRTDPTGRCPECELVGEAAEAAEEAEDAIVESPVGQFVETKIDQLESAIGETPKPPTSTSSEFKVPTPV